tara:strand:- start:21544 stop:22248 length:705 start_codon:yes stop_codon:yes gene_type:complete
MSISIIIPAKNEDKIIKDTIRNLKKKLKEIDFEIIVIDDFSTDNTFDIIKNLKIKNVFVYKNKLKGVASAIKLGIKFSKKKYICIYMADQSDGLTDLINYYKLISNNKIDAVFGSRFIEGSKVVNYPKIKYVLNRFFNLFVKIIYISDYNDFTNAFKIYSTKKIKKLNLNLSTSFEIFLELPLKFINKKGIYLICSISWRQRKKNLSKFKINELGSKYLKVLIYCLLNKIGLIK